MTALLSCQLLSLRFPPVSILDPHPVLFRLADSPPPSFLFLMFLFSPSHSDHFQNEIPRILQMLLQLSDQCIPRSTRIIYHSVPVLNSHANPEFPTWHTPNSRQISGKPRPDKSPMYQPRTAFQHEAIEVLLPSDPSILQCPFLWPYHMIYCCHKKLNTIKQASCDGNHRLA